MTDGVDGFTQLDQELRYSGYAIDVFSTVWRAPSGEEFQRDIVRHPGAVAVVAVTDDGGIVMVRQFRTPLGRELLEIPAGIRDVDGESDEDTGRRELREEAGLIAERVDHLVSLDTAVGFCDERIEIYLATGLSATDPDAQGAEEELMTVEVVPLADIDARIAARDITDSKTIAGILMARLRLEHR